MPKVANIYIDGEILPQNYIWPEEVATSLIGVRQQIEAAGEFDSIRLNIFSPGGYCVEGWAICDYLLTLGKPISTFGYGQVASIATVFFLLGNERLLTPNCEFMVHLPWGWAMGNRYEFQAYLDMLIVESDKLISYYVDKTELEESFLADKMRADWLMTPSEAVTHGFATAVSQPQPVASARYASIKASRKPVFLLDLKDRKEYKPGETQPTGGPTTASNKQTPFHKMNAKEKAMSLMAAALALFSGKPLKALDVATTSGQTLVIDATGENGAVNIGDTATIDGNPAPDGDYTASADNTVYTIMDGKVDNITKPDDTDSTDEDSQDNAGGEGSDNADEVTALKTENANLKAQVATLQANLKAGNERLDKLAKALGPKNSKDVNLSSGKDKEGLRSDEEQDDDSVLARRRARKAAQQEGK